MIPSSPRQVYHALRPLIDELRTLISGSSSSQAAQLYSFVFQPGGTPGANVFTTWSALDTAMGLVAGPKRVTVDGRFGATTVPTAGMPVAGWFNSFNDVTFVPRALEGLTFAANAKIDPTVVVMSLANSMFWQNTGTVVWAPTSAPLAVMFLTGVGSGFTGSPGGAFISIGAGHAVSIDASDGAGFGDVTDVAVGGTGSLDVSVTGGGVITAGSVANTLTYNITKDASGETDLPQGAAFATFSYVAPPNILQELDAAGQGAAAALSKTTTGTIQRLYSGRVKVTVQVTVTQGGGAAGNVLLVVQRDGATIAGSLSSETSVPSGSLGFLAVTWEDTLPDNATHHYGWHLTTSAGTIAIAGGQSSITAVEEK